MVKKLGYIVSALFVICSVGTAFGQDFSQLARYLKPTLGGQEPAQYCQNTLETFQAIDAPSNGSLFDPNSWVVQYIQDQGVSKQYIELVRKLTRGTQIAVFADGGYWGEPSPTVLAKTIGGLLAKQGVSAAVYGQNEAVYGFPKDDHAAFWLYIQFQQNKRYKNEVQYCMLQFIY